MEGIGTHPVRGSMREFAQRVERPRKSSVRRERPRFDTGSGDHLGARGSLVVKAVCHKPEGRLFDTR
jgi:hypothetical protein